MTASKDTFAAEFSHTIQSVDVAQLQLRFTITTTTNGFKMAK
jgi:hypothetical protein